MQVTGAPELERESPTHGPEAGRTPNFGITDEQQMLVDMVKRLFADNSTTDAVRAAEPSGFDPALWQILREAGVPTMRVPENRGGGGSSLLDALLVAEQAGRYMASAPIAEAMVAARLLAALDTPDAARWLERVHAGKIVTLALAPVMTGVTQVIPGGGVAEAVLCLDGDALVLIAGAPTPTPSLASTPLVQRILSGPEAVGERLVLAAGDAAIAAYQAAVEEWKLLIAAMLSGLGRRALELAADYSKERVAFGRPIGGFQGIAHPLADAVTDMEGAQLLVHRAAWAIARGRQDAAASVSMAFWWAVHATSNATKRALRTFGGYGVSLEYDIHLFYRRAKAWPLVAGDPQLELLRGARRMWCDEAVALPDAGEMLLEFGLGSDADAFGAAVRAFFEANLTPALRAHAHHSVAGFHPEFNRTLAAGGFLFPHWPAKYGGLGRTAYDMAALHAVLESYGWENVTAGITNQVAHLVMEFSSDEAKTEVMPRFAAGDALACMGFTEPSCGSDVFAAKTRAERQPDGNWLINGSKIFTTAANLAHYCFLLTRTNPDKPKHAGLTMFLVPLDTPGVEIHPVLTLQDERTNIVYFSDVRLDDKYRVGEVDGGANVMAATLEMEHAAGNSYRQGHVSLVHAATAWALQATRNCKPLLDDVDAAMRLMRTVVHLEVSTLLCYRGIWGMVEQLHSRYWGPMAKLFATEYYLRDAQDLIDLAAPDTLFPGSSGLGHIEIGYRQSIGTTIYGGTSEVQRSLVAEQALGMPKSRS